MQTMYSDHAYVSKQLQATDIDASEFHGLLCGAFCSSIAIGTAEWQRLISPYLPEFQALESLSIGIWEQIEAGFKSAELDLSLLLPEEDAPMDLRVKCLASWCGGFNSGFRLGESLKQKQQSEEVRDILKDFESITRLNDRVEDSDENETDFMELEEYARMAAIMIYTDRTP